MAADKSENENLLVNLGLSEEIVDSLMNLCRPSMKTKGQEETSF